jgi:ketosteroid isomerase-like protein
MDESDEVRAAWLEFCDRLSAGDVESFDRLVSTHPGTLVIGTAPGEWVRDRTQLRHGFEAEGVALRPRNPVAFVAGELGWLTDEVDFAFPDGTEMDCRFTVVMRREDDRWKLVHMHASVGVPDEEVVALQRRWASAG